MTTNITNITNINSFYDLGKFATDASNGLFFGVILIALFIIIITRLRLSGHEDAILASSVACLFISLILLGVGYVQIIFPVFFALALAGSMFYKNFRPQ